MRDSYDYVIVGAGSAGCVLANRLSANPDDTVLLIESGPDDKSPLIAMPRGIGKLLAPGNPHVWDYRVAPGGNAAPETWLKGRAIGGSSSINGMVYVRGAPDDYDGWAALGCPGWGWSTMGRHFVALEDHALGAGPWRGAGGPLHVSVHPSGHPLCEAVLAAAGEMGVPHVADVNDVGVVADQGMGYQTTTTYRGRRFSAARAFLSPVRSRPNLHVATGVDAMRIVVEDGQATAIVIRDAGHERRIAAAGEVIVCAGAIESPKLLQLSGIGPGSLLQAHGIHTVVDSPGVGHNLREHRYLSTQYRVSGHSLNKRLGGLGLFRSMLSYLLSSSGPLTHAAHEVGGFVKTLPGLDRPDAQIGMGLYSFHKDANGAVAIDPHPGMSILGYFTRPESQGVVRIASPDPDTPPVIEANHLSAPIDRERAVSLFRWLKALGRQPALRDWIIEETGPAATIECDEDLLANAIGLGGTAFHVAGTCRMGSDDDAVLDPALRVRGVRGLRVADTSIMPTLVSGNTNAPAMAIGLNAADLILRDR